MGGRGEHEEVGSQKRRGQKIIGGGGGGGGGGWRGKQVAKLDGCCQFDI